MIDLNTVVTVTIPVTAFGLFLYFFHRISQRTFRVRRVVVAAATTDLELEPPTPQEVEIVKGAVKINVDVDACPRCGKAHADLEFDRFGDRPVAKFTHFATCPETKAPILIAIGIVHDASPVKAAAPVPPACAVPKAVEGGCARKSG